MPQYRIKFPPVNYICLRQVMFTCADMALNFTPHRLQAMAKRRALARVIDLQKRGPLVA